MKYEAVVRVVSSLAVVASLGLVAYELHQNNKEIVEANRLGRMQSASDSVEAATRTRQMIIENSEVWSKAITGEPLTDEEDMICELISHTYFFTIGQLYEQAVHLNDDELIASRLSLPARLKKNYSPVKNYWIRVRPEFISKGYGPLAESFDRAFANPKL